MKFSVSTSGWKARALVVTCALTCAAPISAADEFTAGVTDFPSRLTGSETFVPGVTDVPNAFASTPVKRTVATDDPMPRAMPSDYSMAGVELPTPHVPATIAPASAPAVDRFDWRDAGVGAAIAVVALALAAGAGLLGRSLASVARSRAQGAH